MKERDNRIDSIKGFLIILVVLGHIIGICGNGVLCERVWLMIYIFHMPLFVLISGYFTSNTENFWRCLSRIVWPLFIFHILCVCLEVVVFKNFHLKSYLFTPYWTLWYLMSLFTWRILTRYTSKMLLAKPFFYLTVAFVFSVFSGLMINGRILSIQRTINFFPFFLFGYYLKQGVIKIRFSLWYVSYGLIMGVIVLIVCSPCVEYENIRLILRGTDHYTLLDLPRKIYYMLLSVVVSISIFNIFPESKLLCLLGKHSMFYYLYHGLIIKFILYPLVMHFKLSHSFGVMLLYLISIMCLIFIMKRVKLFNWFVFPLFKQNTNT